MKALLQRMVSDCKRIKKIREQEPKAFILAQIQQLTVYISSHYIGSCVNKHIVFLFICSLTPQFYSASGLLIYKSTFLHFCIFVRAIEF